YLEVPLIHMHDIVILKRGYKPFEKKGIRLSKAKSTEKHVIPKLEKQRVEKLSTTITIASGSKIRLNVTGIELTDDRPFNDERIPAGEYDGVIVNPLLGTKKKVHFEIKENKKHFLE